MITEKIPKQNKTQKAARKNNKEDQLHQKFQFKKHIREEGLNSGGEMWFSVASSTGKFLH